MYVIYSYMCEMNHLPTFVPSSLALPAVAPQHKKAAWISVQDVCHKVLVLADKLLARHHVVQIAIVGQLQPSNSGSAPAEESALDVVPDPILS